MTTIAYRDGVMAADTALTTGDSYKGEVEKIFRCGEFLAGAAGTLIAARKFMEWLVEYAEGDEDDPEWPDEVDDDVDNMVVDAEGTVYWLSQGMWIPIKSKFHAIGSGEQYAIGAMAAGMDALGAVEIAAQFDKGTRGPFTTLKLEE